MLFCQGILCDHCCNLWVLVREQASPNIISISFDHLRNQRNHGFLIAHLVAERSRINLNVVANLESHNEIAMVHSLAYLLDVAHLLLSRTEATKIILHKYCSLPIVCSPVICRCNRFVEVQGLGGELDMAAAGAVGHEPS